MSQDKKIHRKVARATVKVVNFKLGGLAALFMGSVVYVVNMEYGFMPAFTAAMKQAVYTLLFGGMIAKLVENIVVSIDDRRWSVFSAVMTAWALTSLLVYIVHNFKGTPEPFNSTIPTILLAPPGLIFVAIRRRRMMDRSTEE